MWILAWLPSWIFWLTLAIGGLGLALTYFLRFIPLPILWTYKVPLQIVCVVLVTISVYLLGAKANDESWQLKVKEAEARAALAEAKAQEQNIKVVERVVYRNRVIREKAENIIKYVDREIVKYDTRCEIPPEFTNVHNDAARRTE
jgi:hypothetical protein